MNEDLKYQKAKERVEEIKGVYVHAFLYLIINFGLVMINLLTNREHLWFYWPALGWGIGLCAHVFSVFVSGGWLGSEWEEKKIKQIMKKMDSDSTDGK